MDCVGIRAHFAVSLDRRCPHQSISIRQHGLHSLRTKQPSVAADTRKSTHIVRYGHTKVRFKRGDNEMVQETARCERKYHIDTNVLLFLPSEVYLLQRKVLLHLVLVRDDPRAVVRGTVPASSARHAHPDRPQRRAHARMPRNRGRPPTMTITTSARVLQNRGRSRRRRYQQHQKQQYRYQRRIINKTVNSTTTTTTTMLSTRGVRECVWCVRE